MEFFRHCPECGRRFHIKLETKKIVSLDREPVPRIEHGVSQLRTEARPIPVIVHDERLVILDVEQFQYVYKCKHCGNEWSEKHIEEHRER